MMKRLMIALFLLYLSSGILTSPVPEKQEESIEDWMAELYTDWDKWDQRDKDAVISMFRDSRMKYKWFPDKYLEPDVVYFTIYPDGHTKRKIEEILNE